MPRYLNPRRARPGASAFTLIELLSVIAVIGILVAILIPVTGRVRAAGKAAKCAANLRTVHNGFNLYAADNQGYYPAARFHPTQSNPARGRRNRSFNNGAYGNHWEGELAPYVGVNLRSVAAANSPVATFAICPDGLTGMNAHLVYKGPDFSASGYSLDYQVKAIEIRAPTKTILAGDSDDYHLGLWLAMLPDADGKYTSGDPVRHANEANYLFADGHVAKLSLAEAFAALQEAKAAR